MHNGWAVKMRTTIDLDEEIVVSSDGGDRLVDQTSHR
jgi:hypothetical protein